MGSCGYRHDWPCRCNGRLGSYPSLISIHSFLSETNPSKNDFPLSIACLCSAHLQRWPFLNCDTFEGFLRAPLYPPIHHRTENNFYIPLYYEWNARAMSFTGSLSSTSDSSILFGFSFLLADEIGKASLKVFAFSTSLIRIAFVKYQHSDEMGKSVPADSREKETWKACPTLGSRNMMELKQLDLNPDQLQASLGSRNKTAHFIWLWPHIAHSCIVPSNPSLCTHPPSQFLMPSGIGLLHQRVSLFLGKWWMLISWYLPC